MTNRKSAITIDLVELDDTTAGRGGVRFNGANMDADILREIFRQANRGGGGTFRGGPGMQFHFPGGFAERRDAGPRSLNVMEFLPAPIRAIISVIPAPLLIVMFFCLFAVLLSAFLNFMMSMGHFLLFVMYFVPSKLKCRLFLILWSCRIFWADCIDLILLFKIFENNKIAIHNFTLIDLPTYVTTASGSDVLSIPTP